MTAARNMMEEERIDDLRRGACEFLRQTSDIRWFGEWEELIRPGDAGRRFRLETYRGDFIVAVPDDPRRLARLMRSGKKKVLTHLCLCSRCHGHSVRRHQLRYPSAAELDHYLPVPEDVECVEAAPRAPERVVFLLAKAKAILAPKSPAEWRLEVEQPFPWSTLPHSTLRLFTRSAKGRWSFDPLVHVEIPDDPAEPARLRHPDEHSVDGTFLEGRNGADPETTCRHCGGKVERTQPGIEKVYDRRHAHDHFAQPWNDDFDYGTDEPDWPWQHVELGPIDWDEEDRKWAAEHCYQGVRT